MHQKQNPAHYGGKSMERFELQIIMRSDKDGYLAHGMFDGKGVTVFKGSQISVSEQDKKDIRRFLHIRLSCFHPRKKRSTQHNNQTNRYKSIVGLFDGYKKFFGQFFLSHSPPTIQSVLPGLACHLKLPC